MLEDTNYPLPDPAWDYYLLWHNLHRAKAQIDQALAHLKEIEVANSDSDRFAYSFIQGVIATLQQALPPDEPT